MNEKKMMMSANQEMAQDNTAKSAAEKYLSIRKIQPETAKAFNVHGDDEGNIVFPYYRSEDEFQNGDTAFQKQRPARKLTTEETEGQTLTEGAPILFGMHLCDPDKGVLHIFEDEFECMVAYQADIKNCVALPCGDSDFSWNAACSDFISRFRRASVITSNSESGRSLALEISRKIKIPTDMPDRKLYGRNKSLNAVLYEKGGSQVAAIVKSAKPEPIPGLIDISKIPMVSVKKKPRVMTGISKLDYVTGGYYFGGVDVWTGKTGEGKSTFLSQMLLESMEQGFKVFAYSGELDKMEFRDSLYKQAAGTKYLQVYTDEQTGREGSDFIPEVVERINQWIEGKFWLYDKNSEGANDPETLLEMIENAYRTYDCRVFLVDNMMTLNTQENGRESYEVEAKFTSNLCQLASKLGILVHLIIHPRKTDGKPVTSNDDIGGSSKNANLASAVFSIRKVRKHEAKSDRQNAAFTCMKGRNKEIEGSVALEFHPLSNRFVALGEPEKLFDYSGGIPAYIIKIFQEAQVKALMAGRNCIDEKIVQQTVDTLAIRVPKTYSGGTYLSDFEIMPSPRETVVVPPKLVVVPDKPEEDAPSKEVSRLYANKRGRKNALRDEQDLLVAFKNGGDFCDTLKEIGLLEVLL